MDVGRLIVAIWQEKTEAKEGDGMGKKVARGWEGNKGVRKQKTRKGKGENRRCVGLNRWGEPAGKKKEDASVEARKERGRAAVWA